MIPRGFRFSGVRCGLKNKRNDLGLIVSDRPATAAGVFTQNLVHASCVDFSQKAMAGGSLQGVVVNSGNANCCTGLQGERDTAAMGRLAAEHLGLEEGSVAVASTGVIGKLLDMAKVEKGIVDASKKLGQDSKPFVDAILTTDLVEKEASAQVDGGVIYGVCKGSGMIAPNMATMLCFIVTDLDVPADALDHSLRKAVADSFNCLTVDSDTSTNDMVVLMANGASGITPEPGAFERGLFDVCLSLTKQIAKDGEGATKLIEIHVQGSTDPKTVARTIADSPLVKTAMFGCDPNWGRILAAAGRAGVPFDPEVARLVVVASGEDHVLYEDGAPAGFDAKHVSTALKSDVVRVELDLGPGESATIYTCDFGYGYVRINAEYHT